MRAVISYVLLTKPNPSWDGDGKPRSWELKIENWKLKIVDCVHVNKKLNDKTLHLRMTVENFYTDKFEASLYFTDNYKKFFVKSKKTLSKFFTAEEFRSILLFYKTLQRFFFEKKTRVVSEIFTIWLHVSQETMSPISRNEKK
jgi:hypothetical protein